MPLCSSFKIKGLDGLCNRCYCFTNPDGPIVRNYKTKENYIINGIKLQFPNLPWVVDKRILDGCSKRRPDLLLHLGSHAIIVEIDEYQHVGYECECDNRRTMEISADLNHIPIVFIRFNPDGYINVLGVKISSTWRSNNGLYAISKTRQQEFDIRVQTLHEQIGYWTTNVPDKTVLIIQLWYDGSI